MPDENRLSSGVSFDTTDAKVAISQLNRHIRVLESGFRASAASLGDWTKTAQGNEARMKTLGGIMAEQKKKISALSDEYDDIVEKHGASSRAAEDLEIKINKEKEALAKNEAELKKCAERLEDLKDDTEDNEKWTDKLGTAFKNAAKDGGFFHSAVEKLGNGLKVTLKGAAIAAGAAIAGVTAAMKEGITTAYEWAANVGTTADDLNTLSQQTGLSTDTLQRWAYAGQFIDTDLPSITDGMRQITAKMGEAAGGSESAAEGFEALGVSLYDANGQMRSGEDVFMDTITALGGIANETERDALAMTIFGESAQNLNPLIEAGIDNFEALGDEAESMGLILDEEALAMAGAFSDTQAQFNSQLTAMQNSIGLIAIPAFSSLLETVTGTMSSINTALADGFQEEDMEVIGEALTTGLTEAVSQISGLVETVTPYLLEFLVMLVDSLSAMLPEVIPPLITAAVSALSSIAENLPEIVDAIILGLQAVDWAATAQAIIDGLVGGLQSAAEAALDLIKGVAETIWNAVLDFFGIHSPSTLASDAGGFILDGLVAGMSSAVEAVCGKVKEIFGKIWSAIKSIFGFGEEESAENDAKAAGGSLVEGIGDGIAGSEEELQGKITQLTSSMLAALDAELLISDGSSAVTKPYGEAIVQGVADGAASAESSVFTSAALAVYSAAQTAFADAFSVSGGWGKSSYSGQFASIGASIAQGIADGITNSTSVITSAAVAAAQAAIAAAKEELDINSPSRVAEDVIGKNFSLGIAGGVLKSIGAIEESASLAGSAAVIAAGSASTTNNYFNNTVTANVRNEEDIDHLARELAERSRRIARGYGLR